MKRNFFKTLVKLSLLALSFLVIFTSCKKDDDDGGNPPVLVEDGFYVTGAGTALTDLDSKGMMKVAKNEVTQTARPQLLELYIAVKGGADGFSIVEVSGETKTTYGPGADFAVVPEAERLTDEPKVDFWRGSYTATETKFTVPSDGLYHVVIDTELEMVIIAPVQWGIIGGATPTGWSSSTPLTQGAFNLNTITFEAPEVVLLENEYKFRYSDGWKISLDEAYNNGTATAGLRVNTNFGGAVNALVPGGANIANATYAVYKVTMTWSLENGTTAAVTYVKDGDPLPEYPAQLFMVGSAVDTADTDDNGTPDGWQWELTNQEMVPVHSHPEMFWKIVWLYEGQAMKFAPGREWVGDFGKDGDATDGVFAKGSTDVPVPGASGYYIVVVDLANETIEVNPAKVYGIGDAFGSWDAGVEANLFTVDNTAGVIKFENIPANGNLRMYAKGSTLAADWWQAEFNIIDGNIEYRGTGGDQTAVPVTAGQTVTLNFKEGTGTIE
ncbi:MAG TPA: SusF/SusE family outer membrane protein [Bacteroidales bacterium]|nr:SusF/SusE family outer membrane protein [Bacteroidales bacterium]